VGSTSWWVAPGYERLAEVFEQRTAYLGRGGGAYCAYVDGAPAVDLWAGQQRPGLAWRRDTLCVLMSLTKGLAAVVVQQLVDRGQLDLDAPVAAYWPEFAQAGKERALVRHVMMHTVGLAGPADLVKVTKLDGRGWDDLDAIADVLARATPDWEPGTQQAYHALTWGWIVAELVRRVTGRTLGECFADDIARPLGIEAFIGTPAHRLPDVARIYGADMRFLPLPLRKLAASMEEQARDPKSLLGRSMLAQEGSNAFEQLEVIFNDPRVHQMEIASGGGVATARGVARLFAMLGNGGELDGERVLSRDIVDDWSRVITAEPDYVMAGVDMSRRRASKLAEVPRTFAYLGNSATPGIGYRFGPNPAAIGAEGLGGQHGWFDTHSRVAVGYVRSHHTPIDVLQPELDRLLYACARELGHDVFAPPPRRLLDRTAGIMARRIAAKASL
jgi:CubicO group peptidase (beta-lactamase class C family)